jgi:hypothetical protein
MKITKNRIKIWLINFTLIKRNWQKRVRNTFFFFFLLNYCINITTGRRQITGNIRRLPKTYFTECSRNCNPKKHHKIIYNIVMANLMYQYIYYDICSMRVSKGFELHNIWKHKTLNVLNRCVCFVLHLPCTQRLLNYLAFQSFDWEYLMKVTTENAVYVHWFRYLQFLVHYIPGILKAYCRIYECLVYIVEFKCSVML